MNAFEKEKVADGQIVYSFIGRSLDKKIIAEDLNLLPPKSRIRFNDLLIDKIFLDELNFSSKTVIFYNCTYEDDLVFFGNDTIYHFSEDPSFNENFNDERRSFSPAFLGENVKLFFRSFNNYFIRFQDFYFIEVRFNYCIYIALQFSNSEFDLLIFKDSKIDTARLNDITSIFLQFENTEFLYSLEIESGSFEKILFQVCDGKSTVLIRPSKILYLELNQTNFNSFIFEILYPDEEIPEKNTKILEKIEITNSKSVDTFLLNDKTKGEVIVKKIYLKGEYNLSVFSFSIEEINFTGLTKGKSEFNNCFIENLNFNLFSLDGKLLFNNVSSLRKNGLLNFANSLLDNVLMNPSFLHQFGEIKFLKSSILNLVTYNLIDIPDSTLKPTKKDLNSNYLSLYRELKVLALMHNDNYLAQRFKALEYNELLEEKGQKIPLYNWLILNLNKLSNNHSTNPFLALGWMFVLAFFYSIVLILSLTIKGTKFEITDVFRNLTFFINPIKLLGDFDLVFHNVVYIIDFFYKIAIGYLVYQFIAAFRKFNK